MTTQLFEIGEVPQLTFPQRLRIARENAGLDQHELAELIGVTRNTVSNAESGRVKARKVVVNAWAMATKVPASWLFSGDDPKETGHPRGRKDLGESDNGPRTYKGDVSDRNVRPGVICPDHHSRAAA